MKICAGFIDKIWTNLIKKFCVGFIRLKPYSENIISEQRNTYCHLLKSVLVCVLKFLAPLKLIIFPFSNPFVVTEDGEIVWEIPSDMVVPEMCKSFPWSCDQSCDLSTDWLSAVWFWSSFGFFVLVKFTTFHQHVNMLTKRTSNCDALL